MLDKGTKLGPCKILEQIGRGGMGHVYRARHLRLDRVVAVKVLANIYEPAFIERFILEARAAARLEHPNIVHIYDADKVDDFHYIVMQYVEGWTLAELLRECGPVSPREALEVVVEVAHGLEAAHGAGLIHRDIKPGNIIISKRGEIKIMDFGLVKDMFKEGEDLTQSGQILGSPHYMSPEQCQGRVLDGRSDIYSLGVTLYYMLTRRKPFEGETAVSVILKHMEGRFINPKTYRPELPDELCRFIERMLSKDPNKRPQSAGEVITFFEGVIETLPAADDNVLRRPDREITTPETDESQKTDPLAVTIKTRALRTEENEKEDSESRWVLKKKPVRESRRYKMRRNLIAIALAMLAIFIFFVIKLILGK
jgi:serine/threonine-protein kinase